MIQIGVPRWLEAPSTCSQTWTSLAAKHRAINLKIQLSMSESMCEWVCTWTSVQGMCVSGREPACLQGMLEQEAQALLVEWLLPPLLPSLAQHLWMCRFGEGAILKNFKYPLWEEVSGIPIPWCPDVSLCPLPWVGLCTQPLGARAQGLWYLLGRKLLLPLPWAPWKPQTRQSLANESVDWLRCYEGHRQREMAWVVLAAETMPGAEWECSSTVIGTRGWDSLEGVVWVPHRHPVL